MFETVFDQGNLPEDMYNDMIAKFIEDFKEKTGKDLEIGEGGKLSESKGNKVGNEDDIKKITDTMSKLGGGLGQVSSGLKQLGIDMPKEVDEVIGVINAVSSVIQGVQTVISIFGTSALTANTAAVVANTAALGVNTATNFIPGVSTGGIAWGGKILRAASGAVVPGNYGYDAVPALLTSGEVVLNRAQQGVLAEELEGNAGLQNLHLETVLTSEDIIIMLNNNANRRGLKPFFND
jgi:hypothetical protein